MSLPETHCEQSRWVFKRALVVTAARAFGFNASILSEITQRVKLNMLFDIIYYLG